MNNIIISSWKKIISSVVFFSFTFVVAPSRQVFTANTHRREYSSAKEKQTHLFFLNMLPSLRKSISTRRKNNFVFLCLCLCLSYSKTTLNVCITNLRSRPVLYRTCCVYVKRPNECETKKNALWNNCLLVSLTVKQRAVLQKKKKLTFTSK